MKTYPLFKVHVQTQEALDNIKTVFESGFINEGVQVTQLTKELSKILKSENLSLTNSCTSALTLALKLANVKPGDRVVSTPMTCVATNTPITNLGAKIVWADINSKNGMIQPWSVEELLNSGSESDIPKAVIAVAWAGTPPELRALKRICNHYDVPLILDAAHAFGATYENIPVHEWADYTCYSFQAIKHFTTGDGGGLICAKNSDHNRAKALKWFGLDRDKSKDANGNWKGQQWDVDIEEAGYKFNMNNVSAAIGLSQINHINKNLQLHRQHAALYDKLFEKCESIKPAHRPAGGYSSFWVYTVRLTNDSCDRDDLLKKLNAIGIMAGIVHVPNHEYTAFKEFKMPLLGCDAFSTVQFSLPCGWWLTDDDIHHIAKQVIELSAS